MISYADIILTIQERERPGLDHCYNQGKKHTHKMSQEVGMPLGDIGAILKKAQEEKNTSIHCIKPKGDSGSSTILQSVGS